MRHNVRSDYGHALARFLNNKIFERMDEKYWIIVSEEISGNTLVHARVHLSSFLSATEKEFENNPKIQQPNRRG